MIDVKNESCKKISLSCDKYIGLARQTTKYTAPHHEDNLCAILDYLLKMAVWKPMVACQAQ